MKVSLLSSTIEMAFATAKFSEMPLKINISLPLTSYSQLSSYNLFVPKRSPSIHLIKPFASLRANESSRSSSPVARPLSRPDETVLNSAANRESETRTRTRFTDGERGQNAIDRIVLRLRNLGLGSDDEDCQEEEEEEAGINGVDSLSPTGEERLGDLLKREWIRPDEMLIETAKDEEVLLPWEKEEVEEKQLVSSVGAKKKTVRAPSLAELTIEDEELRRLRRIGMYLRERINVPKAGTTQAVLDKIHDRWRKEELVRLKFHEELATDMRTAHEIVERRTGGLVIWRSGSVMVVYRGSNYEGPYSKSQLVDKQGEALFIPDVSSASTAVTVDEHTATSTSTLREPTIRKLDESKIITEEETEFEGLLDGLGPRFVEWWGTGILPVDADLLPQKIPGYKTPYRLLPAGMRPRLTNAEMTNLRKLAKSLPCHFALGRNRSHQGLAVAILKLWEKSLVAKIAVKRGIQNTNNKLMAEEIKELTGGVLLLRNKYYIVIYRGKDFIPTSVSAVLSERQELTKQIQDVEERVRIKSIEALPSREDKSQAVAGTLAEFYEAQARWGANVSAEDREKMIQEDNRSKRARIIRRIDRKLAVAQAKKLRAEKLLAKIEASMLPAGPDYDQETITDEERVMFRRLGLRMKPYLPLGIRGVFDGVIENMHLHWKHRELVKLISKQKTLAFVEDSARLLEYESGGILVAIERVPKGFALIYYRGKNYRRPISIRPRNLLTKAKALKRSIAMQRHEALSQHISELEHAIENMRKEIGVSDDVEGAELDNVPQSVECEDKSSYAESHDDDVDFDDDETDDSDSDWENDENF